MARGTYLSPIPADSVSRERFLVFLVLVLAAHGLIFWGVQSPPKAAEVPKPPKLVIELGRAPPAGAAGGEPAEPPAAKSAPPQKASPAPLAPPPAPASSRVAQPPADRSPAPAAATASPREERPAPPELPAPAQAAVAAKAEPADPPAQAGAKVPSDSVRTAEPDHKAAYLNNPRPPYPRNAHRFGIEGTVVLQADVGEDGVPLQVRVFQSSGNGLLDESALQTVAKWRFTPARKDGVMVRALVKIPITFSLKSPSQK